jgi:cellulose synthase operon protein C
MILPRKTRSGRCLRLWPQVMPWIAALALAACNSSTPQALIESGKAHSAKKEFSAAVIQFKSALQLAPQSTEARLLLGEALLASDDPTNAAVELTKALDAKAPAATVLPLLSRALLYSGNYKKLVTDYGEVALEDKAAMATLKANVAAAWGALGDRSKTQASVAAALAARPDHPAAQLMSARLLAGQEKFDEASAIVDGLLARADGNHEAWLLRGEILEFAKRDPAAAQRAYRKSLEIDRSYVPAHLRLISSLLKQRDVPAAKLQANQLRQALPDHPHTVFVDAQLAYLDRDFPKARELTQRLLRVFPNQQGVLMLAGAVEAEMGALVQSSAYFAKILSLNPGQPFARRNLAESEIHLGQYVQALNTLKPLLTSNPPMGEALALAANAALHIGDAAGAERFYRMAAKLDPSDVQIQTAVALTGLWSGDGSSAVTELRALAERTKDVYVDQALIAAHMKRREYDKALEVLDTMIKKQPGKAAHIELRGRVFMARNDLVAARQAFEQTLKLDPKMFSAVVSLANIDTLERKPAQAIERLSAAVAANPKNTVAMLNLAQLKERQGAPVADVKKLLQDAVAASPNVAEPRLRLIEFGVRKRLYKDALAAAQEALTAMPNDLQVLEAAGQAQMQAGDIEQAVSTFRKLAAALPNSPGPYLRLAEVYGLSGKRDQSEAAVRKALEIDPGSVLAQTALVNLLASSSQQRGALDHIARLKQSKPKDPMGYALESAVYVRARKTDAAVASLREGLAKTDSPDLAGRLYSLLLQSKRQAEADTFGAAWIKQHPQDAAFEYLLSVSEIARNDFKAAEQRLKRVVVAYPNNALALNNLAWVMVRLGSPGAVAYAQRAVDLMPDRAPVMDTLALALVADKQVAAALAVQKRAVDMLPEDNELRLGLARIALQAGDKELARAELKKLQQVGAAFKSQAEVEKLMQGL